MSKQVIHSDTRQRFVIPTKHLDDKTLSLEAKGLLTAILCAEDKEVYTVEKLSAISSKDDMAAIKKALDELVETGYVSCNPVPNAVGETVDTVYVVAE